MAIIHDGSGKPQRVEKTYTFIEVQQMVADALAKHEEKYKDKLSEEYNRGYNDGKKYAERDEPKGGKILKFTRSFCGQTIVFQNGQMLVNGKPVTQDDLGQKITYVDGCEITGNVGAVKTMSGSVTVYGDVNGDARTMSGSIHCNNVKGDARTMSGSIYKNN